MFLISLPLAAVLWTAAPVLAPPDPAGLARSFHSTEATTRVALLALGCGRLKTARMWLGEELPEVPGKDRCLWHPDTPLAVVYDGAGRRPASPRYHWRATRHPALAARLQGDWRARGVIVDGLKAGRPRVLVDPPFTAHVRGRLLVYGASGWPIPTVFAPTGPRTIAGLYPGGTDLSGFYETPSVCTAPRTFVPLGPVLLTFTFGADWVEVSVWHPLRWSVPAGR